MLATNPHQNGRTISAITLNTAKVSQKIFRSTRPVYRSLNQLAEESADSRTRLSAAAFDSTAMPKRAVK
jgi:hypothetical protein